jgi:hypothetical protein
MAENGFNKRFTSQIISWPFNQASGFLCNIDRWNEND